jgi:hypothetical protein
MMMECFRVLAPLFLLIACAFGSLTFQVEPKTTDCFYVDVNSGQTVKVIFFVTRGGLLDIDLRIGGPNQEQIYSGMQFESSQFEFVARVGGSHSICWNNEMSRWTAKVVEFEVEIDGKKTGEMTAPANKDELLTPGVLTPVEDSIRRIGASLESIQEDQKYLRSREQKHRDTAESTNGRVFWYSVAESVVLVGISLGQVFYLRKFFEVKRTV